MPDDVIADDGLPMRPSGPWVKEKLDYIRRYLAITTTAMRNKWPRLCYIDLFAGPGLCRVEGTGEVLEGAAMRALGLEHPFSRYILCDIKKANVEALRTRALQRPHGRQAVVLRGDANEVAGEVVEMVRRDSYRGDASDTLAVAVMDPEGFELQAATIGALAALPRLDLIIYYPQSGLARNVEQMAGSDAECTIDRFYGDADWRAVFAAAGGSRIPYKELLELYKATLERFGFPACRDEPVGDDAPLMRLGTGAPLYRLVFASRHEQGNEFWKKVLQRDVHGNRPLPGL